VIFEDQSAHGTAGVSIYLAAIVAWLLVWKVADGYNLMTSRVKSLWIPFLLATGFLAINAVLVFLFDGIGSPDYEESRFVFIDNRAMLAIQALAAILIVATIVYGLTVRRLPVEFIRFMVYAVVAVLGLVAPILWIPDGFTVGFFLLRHFQNAALLIGLFLCVAGIIVMLGDLLSHGEARVVLDPMELLDDEKNNGEKDSLTYSRSHRS
jgi:hypothetical protein